MAGWRDNLRPASFRGVPFEVMESARELGRKVAVHDFPLRDFAAGEDMGKVPGSFSIDGLIIGADYMTKRDAFEAALNQAGTGVLIVPWQGQRTVRLVSARARETASEGGMVSYQLDFIEEQTTPPTSVSADTTVEAAAKADALQTQADASLVDTFTISKQPTVVLNGALSIVSNLSNQFDTLVAPLQATGDVLNDYVNAGMELRANVLDLVAKPLDLAASISGMIQRVRTLAATPGAALNTLTGLMSFGSGFAPINTTTPARRVQAANQAALVGYVRHSAVAEAVKAITEIDFTSYQDAVAVRDDMAERFDDIALDAADAGDDDGWRAVDAARLAMISDVTARGGNLARLYDYTPPVTVPALVLAYQLYDDPTGIEDRAAELVARNDVTHPGFLAGGITLEVLSDV